MKAILMFACLTLTAITAIVTLLLVSEPVSAQMSMNNMMRNSNMSKEDSMMNANPMGHMTMEPGLYAFGTIASLQNDAEGNPAWILSGFYKGSLSPSEENKTQVGIVPVNLPNATLYAKFSMVMTNGSAMHSHKIYDFRLTNMSMPDKSTTFFNGTVTITMEQGPVSGVPISIKSMDNNAISVWVDPSRIENHFGNTPIYGTVEKLIEVHK
jgi:hypothetical protein